MKPCIRNRKLIGCLAAGALEEGPAQELRAHLETCPGCRNCFEKISAVTAKLTLPTITSEVHATESFHQAWLRQLPAHAPATFRDRFDETLQALCLRWRVALVAAGAASVVLLAALLSFMHRAPLSPTTSSTRIAAVQTRSTLAPTLSNYQLVATRSLDEFDALLTSQAQRPPPSAPLYRASTLVSFDTF